MTYKTAFTPLSQAAKNEQIIRVTPANSIDK